MHPRGLLRHVYYSLPNYIERALPGPGPEVTARHCERLSRKGLAATVGYFQSSDAQPPEIVAANVAIARLLGDQPGDVYLSVKAAPLTFDPAHLRTIADAAGAAGLALMFDAQGIQHADRTQGIVAALLPEVPRTGLVIPARWSRSMADAARFRESPARIRIVKGEYPDPGWGDRNVEAHYVALAAYLAGRGGPVAVATHDAPLAERALTLLLAQGTPCELEQLRGLPRRQTVAIAKSLGVPIRLYIPFGPTWWPYAVGKALTRPYLLSWMIRDLLGAGRGSSTEAIPGPALISRAPGD